MLAKFSIFFHLIDCKYVEQILLTKGTSSKNTKQNCYIGRTGKKKHRKYNTKKYLILFGIWFDIKQ